MPKVSKIAPIGVCFATPSTFPTPESKIDYRLKTCIGLYIKPSRKNLDFFFILTISLKACLAENSPLNSQYF